jgi:antigen flippase
VRPAIRSTGLLAGSSIVTVLAGVVSAKVWALIVGTSGVGYLGLLMALIGLTCLFAGLGISAALVRFGADLLTQSDSSEGTALRKAAWIITICTSLLVMVPMVIFRYPISSVMLGSANRSHVVPLMAVAVSLSLITGVQTGILNAHNRVGALARYAILSALAGGVVDVVFIAVWHAPGIPFAALGGTAASCGIATWIVRREVSTGTSTCTMSEIWEKVRQLVPFGASYTASMAAGTAVLLLMPMLVLHLVGAGAVGPYRAAAVIGVTYLGFLLAALAQDYFPRVSASSGSPAELARIINEQQRLIFLIATPIILAALVVAPYVIPVLYTSRFASAGVVLSWQFVGDAFRLWSWTLSYVILARNSARTFFLTELVGGGATLAAGWFGLTHFGLAGAGFGYLVGYVAYLGACWTVLAHTIGYRIPSENVQLIGAAVLAMVTVSASTVLVNQPAHDLMGMALVVGFAVYGLRSMASEWSQWPLRATARVGGAH